MNARSLIAAPKRLLKVATVADALEVCDRTVRRLIKRGELPAHRVGRTVRVAEDDLAIYLLSASCRTRPSLKTNA